ncbi:MAG: glycyl-radical enzyme activating protein [Thermodesulfobacteriota bacterium]
MEQSVEALVVNIQDYSVHDGCGLRSLVFLKGCHLKCKWCQNPECINPGKEIIFREQLCKKCNQCIIECPTGAIRENGYRIDHKKCTMCGRCIEVCNTGALKEVGQRLSVDSLIQHIEKYRVFYDNSDNGGITLSGGDPLFQPEFSMEVFKRCTDIGIHTAMETSAFVREDIFVKSLQYLRLLLVDIKHMDDNQHRSGVGVSNQVILNNLRLYAKYKCKPNCVIRIPLIPGYNDDEDNIIKSCEFVRSIGVRQIDLLPFNIMAAGKYRELGINWQYTGKESQPLELLNRLSAIVASFGLQVTIGGLW